MKGVRIADLKSGLIEHLRRVRRGRSLVVLDRDTPSAPIVPYQEDAATLSVCRPLSEAPPLSRVSLPPPLRLRRDVVELLLGSLLLACPSTARAGSVVLEIDPASIVPPATESAAPLVEVSDVRDSGANEAQDHRPGVARRDRGRAGTAGTHRRNSLPRPAASRSSRPPTTRKGRSHPSSTATCAASRSRRRPRWRTWTSSRASTSSCASATATARSRPAPRPGPGS